MSPKVGHQAPLCLAQQYRNKTSISLSCDRSRCALQCSRCKNDCEKGSTERPKWIGYAAIKIEHMIKVLLASTSWYDCIRCYLWLFICLPFYLFLLQINLRQHFPYFKSEFLQEETKKKLFYFCCTFAIQYPLLFVSGHLVKNFIPSHIISYWLDQKLCGLSNEKNKSRRMCLSFSLARPTLFSIKRCNLLMRLALFQVVSSGSTPKNLWGPLCSV